MASNTEDINIIFDEWDSADAALTEWDQIVVINDEWEDVTINVDWND